MIYTQVNAQKPNDNVIHGAVYYGITSAEDAIARYKKEFPQMTRGYEITAKVYK